MKAVILLLAVTLGVASAATHVNISIAQHAVTNPADVTYIDGEAPAELKAGPAKKTASVERSSRLQNAAPAPAAAEPKRAYATSQRYEQLKQAREQSRRNQEFERYIQNYHSGPTVETVYESASAAEPQRLTASSGQSQRYVAIGGGRSAQQQQQQQQFERQVALPNSAAAAVESSPSAAASAPSANMESERQQAAADVAAPAAAINSNGGYDAASGRAARVGLEPVNYDAAAAAAPAPAGYGSVPSHEQDQLNTYTSNSNNINYDPQPQVNLHAYQSNSNSNNNYDTQPQVNLHSHIPPAPAQEDYSGYGLGRNEHQFPLYAAAAGGGGGGLGLGGGGAYLPQYPQQLPHQPTEYQPTNDYQPHEYLPAEYQPTEYQPRPVVTKTIQIAQPALKAKKFEVRHPAIQKEFYDIEERVVIKPAGTIVVELEHPVAKIPRGETILPLGHPHPAVAGAYNLQPQHGYAAPTQSRAYGVSNADLATAYAPKAEPNNLGSNTIASNLMATPSVGAQESKARNDYIEQNLARQYNSPAPVAAEAPQQQKTIAAVAPAPVTEAQDEYFVLTDSLGNQRRISSKLFTPNVLGKDEPDRAARTRQPTPMQVEARRSNNVQSQPQPQQPVQQHAYAYTANNNNNNNNNQVRYQNAYQPNSNGNANNNQQQPSQQYKNSDYYGADTLDKDADVTSSAAKDEEPARSARLELPRQSPGEPQLRLRQHDFDLVQMVKRLKQQQQVRPEVAHVARVAELPRELYQRPRGNGAFVPYASPSAAVAAVPSGSSSAAIVRPAYARQDISQDRNSNPSVEYSAPYSNMRYVPQQSARIASPSHNAFDDVDRFSDYALGPEAQQLPQQPAHTHIQIQLPHGNGGGGGNGPQRIMVSSTIAPAAPQSAQYRQPHAANSELAADCEPHSERLIAQSTRGQQKFLRLVDAKSAAAEQAAAANEKASTSAAVTATAAAPAAVVAAAPTTPTNSAVENVDVSSNGVSGHVAPVVGAGQRVIAATPAPTGASGSESLHSRRIVVNHPFQTVREVVEHEPVTNYHEVQVNEPTYNFNSPYIQQLTQRTNGALKQFDPTDYQFAYGRSQ